MVGYTISSKTKNDKEFKGFVNKSFASHPFNLW